MVEIHPTVEGVDLSKISMSQTTFCDDIFTSLESWRPDKDSEVALHDLVWESLEYIFPCISEKKIAETKSSIKSQHSWLLRKGIQKQY